MVVDRNGEPRQQGRPNTSGLKAGGHQASSASITTITTALWMNRLRAEDHVSVKPDASPVLHALECLLGWLDAPSLTTLREAAGKQYSLVVPRRCALRPVPRTSAGAMAVGIYAGGQSILVGAPRRLPGGRGWGASVDQDALHRHRATRAHRLGARVRTRHPVVSAGPSATLLSQKDFRRICDCRPGRSNSLSPRFPTSPQPESGADAR